MVFTDLVTWEIEKKTVVYVFFFVIPIVHCAFNPQVHKTVLPTSTEKRDKMSIIQVVLERF